MSTRSEPVIPLFIQKFFGDFGKGGGGVIQSLKIEKVSSEKPKKSHSMKCTISRKSKYSLESKESQNFTQGSQ